MEVYTPAFVLTSMDFIVAFLQNIFLTPDVMHLIVTQIFTGMNILGAFLIVVVLGLGYFARERYDRYLEEKHRDKP